MGVRAEEALDLNYDGLADYLSHNHSVYMALGDAMYYLTDVNAHYWRAQDTSKLNHKDHYTDCSELVPTIGEFLGLPWIDGKTIADVADEVTFYASTKPRSEVEAEAAAAVAE
ncbi:CDP-alcohol phosphatidyltransferase [Atopobiaceae bacterium 24-176]